MPIHPLPVLSDEEERRAIERLEPPKTVVVRYGYMKQIGEYPYDGGQVLGCGSKLVVRTTRGVELATMLTTTCSNSGCAQSISRQQMLQYIDASGGKQYPFATNGKVMRIAGAEDLAEQSRIDAYKPQYTKAAKAAIRELDLPMKLVDVEPLLSGDCIVFYFTAENRIDFRELVKRLAKELHVRVEMRQVGARDEARLVADYEKCGQHCCCKQFLKVLKPVSMRSAKIQKGTLDPSKISGRCGRLMCCLRYEDKTYDQLRKNLPARRSRVMTEDGPGIVISTQILTQLALVELDEGQARQAYPVENIEKITEEQAREYLEQRRAEADRTAEARRDSRRADRGDRSRRRRDDGRKSDQRPKGEEAGAGADGTGGGEAGQRPQREDGEQGEGQGKRRRRRRRRRSGGDRGESAATGGEAGPPRPGAGDGEPETGDQGSDSQRSGGGEPGKRKRRRRRRRRRPGDGPDGGAGGEGGGNPPGDGGA